MKILLWIFLIFIFYMIYKYISLSWIIGVIVVYFIYDRYSVHRRKVAYQKVISDLMHQLTTDPHQFFAPTFNFSHHTFVDKQEMDEFIVMKFIELSLIYKVRSFINANVIPLDITALKEVGENLEKLSLLAYSIMNDRN